MPTIFDNIAMTTYAIMHLVFEIYVTSGIYMIRKNKKLRFGEKNEKGERKTEGNYIKKRGKRP